MSLLAEIYKACPDSYEQGGFLEPDSFIRAVESNSVLDLWWD